MIVLTKLNYIQFFPMIFQMILIYDFILQKRNFLNA